MDNPSPIPQLNIIPRSKAHAQRLNTIFLYSTMRFKSTVLITAAVSFIEISLLDLLDLLYSTSGKKYATWRTYSIAVLD